MQAFGDPQYGQSLLPLPAPAFRKPIPVPPTSDLSTASKREAAAAAASNTDKPAEVGADRGPNWVLRGALHVGAACSLCHRPSTHLARTQWSRPLTAPACMPHCPPQPTQRRAFSPIQALPAGSPSQVGAGQVGGQVWGIGTCGVISGL